MENFIMLILASLPLAAPLPPGLRLACVPVNGEPAVLSAMH